VAPLPARVKTLGIFQRCYVREHNSMQQRALRDKTMDSQASQAIPRISRNSNVHNHVHNSPPLVHVLGQMNTVYAVTEPV